MQGGDQRAGDVATALGASADQAEQYRLDATQIPQSSAHVNQLLLGDDPSLVAV